MMRLNLPANSSAENVARLWQAAMPEISRLGTGDKLIVNADDVESCAGAGEALILDLHRRSAAQGFAIVWRDRRGLAARTLRIFDVKKYLNGEAEPANAARHTRTADQVGRAVADISGNLCGQLAFLGEMAVSAVRLIARPGRLRLRDTMLHFERAGVDALPITLLIGFLLGVILAFMSATSFRRFGVEVYVADLIAIGLFRELGALITAIILAGRSGSAFAAELGSMKVNEEIDALVTLGLPPMVFLAMPRVIAATLVMPLLTIFTIMAGLLGGVLVLMSLGIPATVYWQHVFNSTPLGNVMLGLSKAAVFGLLVGLVGCAQGLSASRSADAVGRAATAAVVGSLVLITVFDGVFAVLAYILGI
ncbi:MAG: ABC transporter permease [Kiritimatiellae bacterium]|nr:ABC transporter permease [Kiritimatiellia bacterium]MDD4025725.1 ABC transporter permease [Kiritimatiellia bacterium]MDD4622304.1 ABC transporter permease [Kiritimatiellia bacterium]